jgi:hypothetical protein
MSNTLNLPLGVANAVKIVGQVLDQNSKLMTMNGGPTVGFNLASAAVVWSSSNTAIATVTTFPGTSDGTIVGIAPGTCNIVGNYTDANGNVAATFTLVVTVYVQAATTITATYPGSTSSG